MPVEAVIYRLQTPPYKNLNFHTRPGGWSLDMHSHAYHQLLIVLSGTLVVDFPTHQWTVKERDLLFMPKEIPHTLYSASGYSQIGIDFTEKPGPRQILQLLEPIQKSVLLPIPEHHKFLITQFHQVIKTRNRLLRPKAFLLADTVVLHVLTQNERTGPDFGQKIDTYLQLRVDQALTLQKVANDLAVSPSHLERLCKQTFGHGLIEQFLEIKADRACVLLIDRTVRIKEISTDLGFNSTNYFSRFFKKRTGLSPLAYRQKYYGG